MDEETKVQGGSEILLFKIISLTKSELTIVLTLVSYTVNIDYV